MAKRELVKYSYIATLNSKPLFFVTSYDEIQNWLGDIPAIMFEENDLGEIKSVTNDNGIYEFHMVPEYKYRNHR